MIKKFMLFVGFFALKNIAMASYKNEPETIFEDATHMTSKNFLEYDPLIQSLEEEAKDFKKLPDEIKDKIVIDSSSDNNSLLKLREISKPVAEIVDQLFYQQSEIKLPLSFLKGKNEKYPYTISYFLRKALWSIPQAKDLQINKFERMAALSKSVGYIGEEAFLIVSKPKFYLSQGVMTNFDWNINNVEATTTDIKEAKIFYSSFMINIYTSAFNYKLFQSILLDPFIKYIFQVAESMSDDEKKSIACYYISLNSHHFLELKDLENAKPFLDFFKRYNGISVESSS